MIKAKELREMKEHPYGGDSVDLALAMNLIMADIIYAAKDGREYHRIEEEEYYDRDTPESCYVLDCLEDLGYTVDKDVEWDAFGEPSFVTIISWGVIMGFLSTIKEALSKHDCGNTCVKCTGVYIPERTTTRECKKYAPCYYLVYGDSHEKCADRGCCDCMKVAQYNPPQGE